MVRTLVNERVAVYERKNAREDHRAKRQKAGSARNAQRLARKHELPSGSARRLALIAQS